MNLTESQKDAMLAIGGQSEAYGFISPRVIKELLACGLVHWERTDEVTFTYAGKEAYAELAARAEPYLLECRLPLVYDELDGAAMKAVAASAS